MKRFIIVTAILLWPGLVQAQEWGAEIEDEKDLVVTKDGEEVWRSSEHENMPDHKLLLITYDISTDYDGDDVPDVVWRGFLDEDWNPKKIGIAWSKDIFAFYSPGKDEVYWVAYKDAPRFVPDRPPCGHIITVHDCLKSQKIPPRVWDALLRVSETYGGYPLRSFDAPCEPTRPRCKKFLR